MDAPKLFMMLLGCTPIGRNTEQHDTFFAIGHSLKEIIPQINEFWPDAGKIHLDAWRQVELVDGHRISIVEKGSLVNPAAEKLFFLNLGGYKENQFDEFHYKVLLVAEDKAAAVKKAKQTAFYMHTGFKGAESHIDDKFGIDVDDIYEITEILPQALKEKFQIKIERLTNNIPAEDSIQLGYFKLNSL